MPKGQANSEDPFAVAVTKGELIVGRFPKTFSAVCSVLLRQSGVNFLLWIRGSTVMCLAFSTCQAKIFVGGNFYDLAFDRENRENFCLAKISHYTVCQLKAYHTSLAAASLCC